jgi:hypothetical protein
MIHNVAKAALGRRENKYRIAINDLRFQKCVYIENQKSLIVIRYFYKNYV